MLATCYSLIFQSTLIDEGHPEYLTFVRGCVLVAVQMGCKGLKFLFQNLHNNDEFEMVSPHLQGTPAVDLGPIDAAYTSLEAFGPLCKRESERKFHACLLEFVCNFYLSSHDGMKSPFWMQKYNADIAQLVCTAWMKANVLFSYSMSHIDFQTLVDPSNPVGQLLQSHLIAVQTLMTPIGLDERGARKAAQFVNGMIRWLGAIHANIEPGMSRYFKWPIERAEEVQQCYLRKRALEEA
jgi:hypothetical protein